MKVHEIVQVLEGVAPKAFAESWDKVGHLIGEEKAPVSRILLALDVTSDVLTLAKRLGSEMLLVHHPLIFSPLPRLKTCDPNQKLVMECVRMGLQVVALHTNWDACLGGVSDALCQQLGLQAVETFQPLAPQLQDLQNRLLEQPLLAEFLSEELPNLPDLQAGYGRIARIDKELHAKAFLRQVCDLLQIPGALFNFDKDKSYRRILLWGGSFDGELIPLCRQKEVDCVVCGEMKHHEMVALAEMGIHVLVVGHDSSERPALFPFQRYLKRALPDCRLAVYTGLAYNNLS